MEPADLLPKLLGIAVLLPLVSFFVILLFGPRLGRAGHCAGYLATSAIGLAALLSFASLFGVWIGQESAAPAAHASSEAAGEEHPEGGAEEGHEGEPSAPRYFAGEFQIPGLGEPWLLGQFGRLRLSVSYYIDSLTVCMFCMVSFIATLIHVYSIGYMHEELKEVVDHEVETQGGGHLHRAGRYHRFFQYLSLFSFSMLGLVLAGNVALVFVFWELVGICSYFLIGFYVERRSASTAANKAFIVNRIGDFGMIVGMMALWTSLGTFSFGDSEYVDRDGQVRQEAGIFSLVGSGHTVQPPDGMVVWSNRAHVADLVQNLSPPGSREDRSAAVAAQLPAWRAADGGQGARGQSGYWLWVVAGIGIFAGCVGKSAQFPLHVWLPDAMEGPTPVSALVHSATMVAAGVYLVGRFYPAFAPEVLLVIAVVGCITLFLAATIAITATDIKRVLAYSTISQLGYMMMALGVGAWLAGMMHLITHAFFKSLLFMCSGSVIHAVHSNEMTDMGGLLKKMPITAATMLVGCLAIAGAGLPFVIGLLGGPELAGLGLSGFYSKDAILEQALLFLHTNRSAFAGVFFVAAAAGAAITAFYMFRLWYLTFLGRPRDVHRHHHAHESPPVMYLPLVILAVMAIGVAWQPVQGLAGSFAALLAVLVWRLLRARPAAADPHASRGLSLADGCLLLAGLVLLLAVSWWGSSLRSVTLVSLLTEAEPVRAATGMDGFLVGWKWPSEHESHQAAIVIPATLIALGASVAGFLLATYMYGLGRLNPDDVRRQFPGVYSFLRNKWWFDELYELLFVKPALVLAGLAARIDRRWIDWAVDGSARCTRLFSLAWDRLVDQSLVDGLINFVAAWTYRLGRSLRTVQTGSIRQYVMFIVMAAVALFVLISFWNSTLAR